MAEHPLRDAINADLMRLLREAETCDSCERRTMIADDSGEWCAICGWRRPDARGGR